MENDIYTCEILLSVREIKQPYTRLRNAGCRAVFWIFYLVEISGTTPLTAWMAFKRSPRPYFLCNFDVEALDVHPHLSSAIFNFSLPVWCFPDWPKMLYANVKFEFQLVVAVYIHPINHAGNNHSLCWYTGNSSFSVLWFFSRCIHFTAQFGTALLLLLDYFA